MRKQQKWHPAVEGNGPSVSHQFLWLWFNKSDKYEARWWPGAYEIYDGCDEHDEDTGLYTLARNIVEPDYWMYCLGPEPPNEENIAPYVSI